MLRTSLRSYLRDLATRFEWRRPPPFNAWLSRDKGQVGAVEVSAECAAVDRSHYHLHAMPRLLPIVTAAVVGVSLSLATYFAIAVREQVAKEQDLAIRATNLVSTLQTGLDKYLEKVVALRALFNSSGGEVSRGSFEIFADQLVQAQPAILSVSWIPRVNNDERDMHELAAARDGLADYHIKSIAADGNVAISPQRDEYYPVYYTTGQYSGSIYGLDLNDGGARESALARARDGDRLACSPEFVLQSGTGDRRGFFVVLPVYRQGLPHDTVESRRRNLVGFVQEVFQTSVMVDTILAGINAQVNLYIFASGANDDRLPVNIFSSKSNTQPVGPLLTASAGSEMHWSGALTVADRQWKVIVVPLTGAVTPGNATAWSLLFAGLLVTVVCVAFMWSSRRHAESLVRVTQKVSELAQTDALTSLANRRAFLDRLAGAFAASERNESPFAVFFIDLDHFKDVNDTLGHAVGDMLLRGVAERLRTSVRRTDFVARIGGDEFAVLLLGVVDIAATGALAAKIVETIAVPYIVEGIELRVTASIGISHSSAEFSQPKAMMVQADLALYRAKDNGRNCFSFPDGEVDQRVQERVTLGNELRAAIEHCELELVYQPQVEISSGNIVGVEALVRWNHPKRGLIAPSIFIPIAEKTGVITALGKWVFDQACRQAKIWQDEGIAPKAVGVNVSALQCSRSDIEKDVAESLARWNVEPAIMEIELTESVLMEVTQQHRDVIGRLRKLGLRIAIDDFGTGYSSLSYLTNYPVDRLKIAQELVLHVSTNCRHASVVRTAIRLAHELNIEVIAEGVETDAQAHFLISADCAYAQGYYYSRPVTVERATALLRERILKPSEQPQRSSSLAAA